MTRLGLWISIGVGLGVAVGVALGNISLGVAMGPAIGVMIWAVEAANRNSRVRGGDKLDAGTDDGRDLG